MSKPDEPKGHATINLTKGTVIYEYLFAPDGVRWGSDCDHSVHWMHGDGLPFEPCGDPKCKYREPNPE